MGKILSVDDSEVVRIVVGKIADTLGLDFLEATSGEEALQILEDEYRHIELVVLDWHMTGMTGYDVLEIMKKHPEYNNIPVIMLTSNNDIDNINAALDAGALHFIAKPFQFDELHDKIKDSLDESFDE